MSRTAPIVMTVLFCTFFAGTEPVSLNGVVTKTGGTEGIEGVKISLVNLPDLSATTGPDGVFTLTGNTASIKFQNVPDEPIQFMVKDNTIIFAQTSKEVCGRVTVFNGQGKVLSSMGLPNLSMGNHSMALPRLSSGIYIMRVAIGPETFTRTLVRVGDDLAIKNEITNANNGDKLMLAKRLTAAALDTLMAEKEGYVVKKVPIQMYTMDNIAISLDAIEQGACTRESLKAIADKYLEAQKAGDPSGLPLASAVTYMQNNKASTADKCMWKTAMPVDFSLSLLDVDSCRAFVEVVSSTGSTPWVMMTWLKVEEGKISEVDAMVTTTGDFMFNAKKYVDYAKKQDWSILTESQKITRQELVAGGDAYLDMFADGVDDGIPWGHPCERIEGGNMFVTPDCIQGMPGHGGMGGTVNITKRRYAVDVDMGTVDVFCSFGGSMPDSHMFRLVDGVIKLVHTLTVM